MLFRVRKVLAGLLMAGSVVFLVAGLMRAGVNGENAGVLVVVAALLLGTLGLAQGAWWGRIVPLAWSVGVAAVSTLALVLGAPRVWLVLAGALVLIPCLSGKEMFARYEGKAPPPLDWTRPGMRLVRTAMIANVYAFLVAVALIPALTTVHSCVLNGFHWQQAAACLAMAAILLGGLVLLARQRTVGLFLVAVSVVGLPLTLMARRGALEDGSVLLFAVAFGPGILCGWLALGRFVPGMVRLLRR
jgi:hypothetical protein